MKKLVIIDEYFVNQSGHYYAYNKSVQEIFKQNGINTVIYANEKLDPQIQEELAAVPYFKGLQKNFLNKIPLIGALINRMCFWFLLYRKFNKMYRLEKDPETFFFFTTVVWYNVLPVALAAYKNKDRKSILLYRLSISEHAGLPASLNKFGDWLYRYTFLKLKKNPNALFCTDSDVIAKECNDKYDCHMFVLPIPHLPEDDSTHSAQVIDEDGQIKKYQIYAPGAIREEKGIDFIAKGFEYLEAIKHPVLEKIILVTQYSNTGDLQLNTNIQERLKKVSVRNIFLGNLTPEDYSRQMNDADIILIPYSIQHGYRARTSGIMSETIAACKPFITTKDSWMSVQSVKYNTGLSITYDAVEEFLDALMELINHYEEYQKKAISAKDGWLAYHSKKNFFNLIMAGIEQK